MSADRDGDTERSRSSLDLGQGGDYGQHAHEGGKGGVAVAVLHFARRSWKCTAMVVW